VNLPEITDVQRLTLKPGDRLIVRTPERLDMATADLIKKRVKQVFGEDVPVQVLDMGMSIEVVTSDLVGYKIGDRVYHPADVTIVYRQGA
jgi:hypothetical protein